MSAGATDDGPRSGVNEDAEGPLGKEGYEDGRRHYVHTVAEMQAKVPLDPWNEETTRIYLHVEGSKTTKSPADCL